jgi:membrane protease YdiL (CAAX protease family)
MQSEFLFFKTYSAIKMKITSRKNLRTNVCTGLLLAFTLHLLYVFISVPELGKKLSKLYISIDLGAVLVLTYLHFRLRRVSNLNLPVNVDGNILINFVYGLGLALPFVGSMCIIRGLLGGYEWRYWDYDALSLTYIFSSFFTFAFLEEIISRGVLLSLFIKYINVPFHFETAIAFQAFLFAASHLVQPHGIAYFVSLFMIGCFFAVMNLYRGTIWFSTGMHSGWNILIVMIDGMHDKYFPNPAGLLRFNSSPEVPLLICTSLLFIFSIYFWWRNKSAILKKYFAFTEIKNVRIKLFTHAINNFI